VDDIRNRFLRDRVLTASPAQRVVMLFDRLSLDLTRACDAETQADATPHLQHAGLIVAELLNSLDVSAGEPAPNLARLYQYLMGEILTAQLTGELEGVSGLSAIVDTLGRAWAEIAVGAAQATAESLASGCWTA
jgi:flagellar secretion chaperone FliS